MYDAKSFLEYFDSDSKQAISELEKVADEKKNVYKFFIPSDRYMSNEEIEFIFQNESEPRNFERKDYMKRKLHHSTYKDIDSEERKIKRKEIECMILQTQERITIENKAIRDLMIGYNSSTKPMEIDKIIEEKRILLEKYYLKLNNLENRLSEI